KELSVERSKLSLVPLEKLVPGVRVALAAQVLEGVGRGHAAELRARLVRQSAGEPLHQPSAKRVAHAGGIDDPVRGDSRNIEPAGSTDHGRSVLASRHNQRLAGGENV